MKLLVTFITLFWILNSVLAADTTVTNDTKAIQQEQLFQRFLKEMRKMQSKAPTNVDVSFMTNYYYTPEFREYFFNQMVVDPSFGYRWDEVPVPTMKGTNAMDAIYGFIATNGWDMQKDGCIFSITPDKSKRIGGLPWTVIHDQEFPAVTHDGILYVFFTGWHWNDHGVAYNPSTNTFAPNMAGFKPIGRHWYVWATTDDGQMLSQEYEGTKK
jgi:hypothetical protein